MDARLHIVTVVEVTSPFSAEVDEEVATGITILGVTIGVVNIPSERKEETSITTEPLIVIRGSVDMSTAFPLGESVISVDDTSTLGVDVMARLPITDP